MKAYQHDLAHAYEPWRSRFRSASLFDSLIIATVVGALVASVGIALFALSRYLQIPWHIAAAIGGVGQVVIVTFLLMIVLEQRRKRIDPTSAGTQLLEPSHLECNHPDDRGFVSR